MLDASLDVPAHTMHRRVGQETILLNLNTERYFSLNAVGSALWQCVVEHGSARKSVETVRRMYDVDETTLKVDFDLVLKDLVDAGLLAPSTRESEASLVE